MSMQPAKQLPLDAAYATAPLDIPPARPPARARRMLKAYWVTFVVIASYLGVKIWARLRSPEALERILLEKHQRNARRIERAILELQGLFIKVGQLISIMTNFLPREFRQELEGLQDQVPPRPFRDIEQRIRDEFGGKGPAELFAEFAERPIAAASIGQVHVARMKNGDKVAVKVQYPDIEDIARADLHALRRILSIVQWFAPVQGLEGVYREVRSVILAELDFRAEAQNVRRIAANFAKRADVRFPRVVEELTTTRILTTVWEDGIKVGDLGRLDSAGVDRRKLAALVVEAYCQQIFIDGIYHADPHPGNVLIRKGDAGAPPTIVFLDFGAVAEVSPAMREGMIQLLQGAIHRDTPRIVAAMRKMGFIPRGADERVYDRVIEYFHQRFQEEIQLDSFSLRDVKLDPDKMFENLADFRRMDISMRELSSSFFVPKEWFLLERTLLLLMGLCTALAPEMNPMHVIRPYLERFVLGEEQDWTAFVVATTKELVLSAAALPGEMRRFLGAAERGQLDVNFRNLDDAARLVYTLGRQVIWVALGIAAAAIAIVLDGRGEAGVARAAWYVAGGAGTMFLYASWTAKGILRRRRKH
jgi:predicted unusual protein kinase regulating ubiquinone biosynthesis (AarF/ABC1/UbiB family)